MTRGRRPRARRPTNSTAVPALSPDMATRLQQSQPSLRRQLSRAEVLADMVRAVNASLEPDRVAEAMLSRLNEWLPSTGSTIVVVDENSGLRPMAARGLTAKGERAAHAVARWIIRSCEPFAAADIAADRRAGVSDKVAALGFPLVCRGQAVGAFVAIDHRPSAAEPRLSPQARAAIESAVLPGAYAIENALRVRRAEALSVTDDLTSLYNSRYLTQVLRRETKRASRNRRPLSLLFLDLDGFKAVNDSHGHLCGSRALVEAAGVIRASARETDVVARFGGDEFALVLPETNSEGALAVAERVRDRIAGHPFLQAEGLTIRLTASVGVATLPDTAGSAETLIQAADRAMYRVKARGKNGIWVAGTDLAD